MSTVHKQYSRWRHERSQGYGLNLYRNTREGKIGGVCAGLADHFEIDRNIMRIIFVAGLLFTFPLLFWGYMVAWVVMAPKGEKDSEPKFEYDEKERCYRKKNVFRYKESTSERIRSAKERLNSVARRVENMEQYITSKRFELNKEFANLEK